MARCGSGRRASEMSQLDDDAPPPDVHPVPKTSWLRLISVALVGLAIYYYTYSFLTLPFVDDLWFGGIPPLAIVQLPKSMLNHRIQDYLISWLPSLGLASGSPSPDMMLTGPWALGLTVTLPALVILGIALT